MNICQFKLFDIGKINLFAELQKNIKPKGGKR